MVTNKSEAIQLDDMDFYIAETTDNDSIKESIKMVRKYLYDMSMENEMIDAEEQQHKKIMAKIAKQRGMTRE